MPIDEISKNPERIAQPNILMILEEGCGIVSKSTKKETKKQLSINVFTNGRLHLQDILKKYTFEDII